MKSPAASSSETSSGTLESLIAAEDRHCRPIIGGQICGGASTAITGVLSDAAIGSIVRADESHIERAFAMVETASLLEATKRAEMLEMAAALIFSRRSRLMALLVTETGLSIPAALDEVRRAAGYCRHVARVGREHFVEALDLAGPTGETNKLRLAARGTFVCLNARDSPLAAFVAQIAAAFMAGNAVVATPPETALLVDALAFRALLEAGIPGAAVAFLPGIGERCEDQLLSDRRCDGVAFSGPTEKAQLINRRLAEREGPIVPLIAGPGTDAFYVIRFANERTVTVNTTAAGGNASLMVEKTWAPDHSPDRDVRGDVPE